ncbi:MAG: DNA polymerase III subunit delta [Lachnospiraceae bacterium]|jgi:DNA polymerase-3 subunit delta'|nr:DNA polymerase III subunit delta [Lachnospiraceae bacterium]
MPDFNDIVGQEAIKKHLSAAAEQDKISHAYIICGERYSGKEFIAKIFAASLLCSSSENKPCGECPDCIKAFSGNHTDIIKVTHDKPGVIGVDDIREQINGTVQIKPFGGKRKIYIMNEAEKMNPQAQNALLKTLEEPPEYTVIILLTSNLEELLPTIRSRAVVLNMRPVKDKEVKKFLMENVGIPDYKADICVAYARGNVGKAKLLANNEEFDNIRDDAMHLMKYVKEMEIPELMSAVKKAMEYKLEINDYLDILTVWYRDVLMFKATTDANNLIFRDEIQYIRKVADLSSYENIQDVIDALDKAKKRLLANVNFELTMELLFLTMKEKLA